MSKKLMRELTAEIVKAYVAGNQLSAKALPELIKVVYDAVSDLDRPTGRGEEKRPTPAVTVGKSVSRHRIVCLEDGRRFKSLKRHLRAAHGLSPEEYRAKWGLDERYPMVAPAYSRQRSRLAVKMGLGRRASNAPDVRKGQLPDAA